MFSERTSVGLDVHARSVVAAAIDAHLDFRAVAVRQFNGRSVTPRTVAFAAPSIRTILVTIGGRDFDPLKVGPANHSNGNRAVIVPCSWPTALPHVL